MRSTRNKNKNRYVASLEELESRLAPAAPIDANWVDLGPQPQQGMVSRVVRDVSSPTNASGRVTSMAFSQNIAAAGPAQSALFVGTASGGIWRSSNWNTFNPTWRQVSDTLVDAMDVPISVNNQPKWINDIGAIAVDPGNPRIIYAGTGEANFSADVLSGAGILKSTTGGDSWKLLSNTFAAKRVSRIFC